MEGFTFDDVHVASPLKSALGLIAYFCSVLGYTHTHTRKHIYLMASPSFDDVKDEGVSILVNSRLFCNTGKKTLMWWRYPLIELNLLFRTVPRTRRKKSCKFAQQKGANICKNFVSPPRVLRLVNLI